MRVARGDARQTSVVRNGERVRAAQTDAFGLERDLALQGGDRPGAGRGRACGR